MGLSCGLLLSVWAAGGNITRSFRKYCASVEMLHSFQSVIRRNSGLHCGLKAEFESYLRRFECLKTVREAQLAEASDAAVNLLSLSV